MSHPEREIPLSRLLLLPVVVLASLFDAVTADSPLILQSGSDQTPMVELYTSQGCSSCPPAEQWLSTLKRNPGLWKEVVPLAFHVDYWDYIGWRDPFARPKFGARQQQYAKQGGAQAVYTPAVMLNGKDWRGWTRGGIPYAKPIRTGVLSVERSREQLLVKFVPAEPTDRRLRVHVAMLGFDTASDVTAGENRGRELNNDFIVLDMVGAPLRRDGTAYVATLPRIKPAGNFPRTALAAWVAGASELAPLQAVGGWWEADESR